MKRTEELIELVDGDAKARAAHEQNMQVQLEYLHFSGDWRKSVWANCNCDLYPGTFYRIAPEQPAPEQPAPKKRKKMLGKASDRYVVVGTDTDGDDFELATIDQGTPQTLLRVHFIWGGTVRDFTKPQVKQLRRRLKQWLRDGEFSD